MAVIIGLKNIYVAKLKSDTTEKVEYDTPRKLAKAIEVSVKPSINQETLYADDGPAEVASSLSEIEVELNIDDLSIEMQNFLIGNKQDDKKVNIDKVDDSAPYVAMGFESQMSNGDIQYTWLFKGKLTLPETAYKTKGENIEFQTPTITAKFIKRDFDGAWRATARTGEGGIDKATAEAWYKAVYEVGKFEEKEGNGGDPTL